MKLGDMLEGIGKLKDAMEAGKQVADPTSWKQAQVTVSRIVAILGLIVFGLRINGVELPMTDEQLASVAGGIAAILGVVNEVMTTVSTKKIGVEK